MTSKKIDWKWLENDWLRQQVETHLIFNIFARYIPFGMFMVVLIIANVAYIIIAQESSLLYAIYDNIMLIFGTVFILQLPRIQQATLGWLITKFTIGILAFLLMTVGAGTSWSQGKSDALPNFLLGIVWLPWIEFIPKVIPK